MKMENRLIPDPFDTSAIQRKIDERGGVDVCYAGFGMSGHVAYNEPCLQSSLPAGVKYSDLPTRVVKLSEISRTQLAMSSGGDLLSVPYEGITIGMKELLSSNEMYIIGLRSWHPCVFRRAMYDEITSQYPASFLQLHPNLSVTLTEHVAQTPVMLPE